MIRRWIGWTALRVSALAAPALAIVALPVESRAQIPATFENLQHFPKDITRDALIQRMREFSFALGVRCQYCHAGGDGISFDGVIFKSDEKVPKQKARFMLRMVENLNAAVLAGVPGRRQPAVRVDCVTCHRGQPVPKTLGIELAETIETKGPAAAVARYRELREKTALMGLYNFGEWTVNELARALAEQGKTDAAIAPAAARSPAPRRGTRGRSRRR